MTMLLQRASYCGIARHGVLNPSVCSSSGGTRYYYRRSFSAQPLHLDEVSGVLLHSHHHDSEVDLNQVYRNSHDDMPSPKIGRLVLVRHGQSEWNVTDPTRNLTARFVSFIVLNLLKSHFLRYILKKEYLENRLDGQTLA